MEFSAPFYSHLVKCALVLVPHPVPRVKKVMFVFILELLNWEGHMAFFELQKGSRKANNARKEKQCLAWKHHHALKQERDCEAVKAAKLPAHECICLACSHKFESRKTTKCHKCAKNSKVVHNKGVAVGGKGLHPDAPALVPRPCAPITPITPTVTSHS